jgi:hypothetical protein
VRHAQFLSLVSICASIVLIPLFYAPAFAQIIFQDNFDQYSSTITGWKTGSQVYLEKSGGVNGSQCVRVNYTGQGTAQYVLSKMVGQHNLQEIYVRFYFKLGPNASGGAKFLKLFGKTNSPSGYANATFALQYASNRLMEVSYGRGTGTVNDTQDVIRYDGSMKTDYAVAQHTSSSAFSPTIGKWHAYEAHIRYNDDNQRNGIFRVWIDGQLKVHATNLTNRHNSNSKFFDEVGLGNYGANGKTNVNWNLYYDEVVISRQYIGPIGSGGAAPSPPPAYAPDAPSALRIVN